MTERSRSDAYDVVVCGGGAAGVAAAVGSARSGARTALLEQAPFLGGAATRAGVLTYCGLWTQADPPREAVRGVASEVLDELRALDGFSGPLRTDTTRVVIGLVECEPLKVALDRVCARAGVDVILHARTIAAAAAGGRVQSLTAVDHAGDFTLTAAAFVDASGEADLAYRAGAATRYGDDDGAVQNGTLAMRIGGIARDAEVSRALWSAAIRAAKANGAPHLRKEQGLVIRLPRSGEVLAFLADEAYDARDARSIGDAERRAREQTRAYVEAIRTLPGHAAAYVLATGPSIGTRESRHVVATEQLRDADVLDARIPDDSVALGAWPVERHHAAGIPSVWKRLRDDGAYGITLAMLTSASHTNLFAAGRVIDAQGDAFSSARVMGTAYATGHAAGIAASHIAAGAACTVRDVRAELSHQNALFALDTDRSYAR